MRNIYALLVGINDYPHPISPLKGCINDIEAVADYLQQRVTTPGAETHILKLTNQKATRQAIISGFQEFLCRANQNDIALFYYSGHGSQEKSPPEFWHLEPDHLDETLVCWDSRTENSWDLADKELAQLIFEVGKNNPHIVVILDCCHSGTGTRDDWQYTGVRGISTDLRQRPLSSFIVSPEVANNLLISRDSDQNPSNWFVLPQGEHILLAACRDNEEAQEYYVNNQHRGAFSSFLIDTLQRTNGSFTYRDLFNQTNARIRRIFTTQSPQLETTNPKNLDRLFLEGFITKSQSYFTVSHDKNYGWIIDGGGVHAIPSVSRNETTKLAIFPFNSPVKKLSQSITSAKVNEVLPQLSKLSISQGSENLDPKLTYKAVLTSLPLPPLRVCFQGDQVGIDLARQALQKANFGEQPSLYICEVENSQPAKFRLVARENQYLITRSFDDRPLVAPILDYTPENASQAIQHLEQIARWTNIVTLSNTSVSRMESDGVKIQLYQGDLEITAPQIRLEYEYKNGLWQAPAIRIKLTNTTNKSLYIALLNLTDRYAVNTGFFPTGGIWLEAGQEAWAMEGKLLYIKVPTELWEQGVTEYKDILKLIVSTNEFDATLLEQDGLKVPHTGSTKDASGNTRSTLNRSMNRIPTRDITPDPEEEDSWEDWVSSQLTITTFRPQPVTPVPNTGKDISLGGGVKLQPHPRLQAKASLTTVTESSRDLGNISLPAILRENSQITQPFQFTPDSSTDPGLSVLELKDIDTTSIDTVTPKVPLKLFVERALGEGEYILPFGYDGEFFLPLGLGKIKNGITEISLERLPNPVSDGKRSLDGSIRIFFHKVISQKLGLKFPYPILAVAKLGENGTVSYEADIEKVKAFVAQAKRIVLYIHGIIGDTQSLVPSLQKATVEVDGQVRPLSENYDLVLTFDYENINTTIEENARLLKQRLEAVDLGLNHGKIIHIIAHSMGGLVSRWFIEREGGNQIVQHLVMLGTPNAGSPWSTVHAWATTSLAIGLNGLSTVAWPLMLLGSLLGATEIIDVSLDQMEPNSEFLKALAANADPEVLYTIIAGNTSIIPTLAASGKLERLMQKLFGKVVDLPFFGQPNDIAVTVQSIKSVSIERVPQPKCYEVACDHLTYFNHEAGLRALALALKNSPDSPTPSPESSVITTTPENPSPSMIVELEPIESTIAPNTNSNQPRLPLEQIESKSGDNKDRNLINLLVKNITSLRGIVLKVVVLLFVICGIFGWFSREYPRGKADGLDKNSRLFIGTITDQKNEKNF